MSLICLASAKGSPGVTTTALGLAAALPVDAAHRKLLLEADAAGGALAIRYQLGRLPGLVTLAAAGRHGLNREDLWSHTQGIPGGLPVVVAPERADRTMSILDTSGARLGHWLAELPDVTTVADAGRLAPQPGGLVATADLVLLVARPTAEQVHPGAALLDALTDAGCSVAWLLVGSSPHPAAEVERFTEHAVARVLPDDARGASALLAGNVTGNASRRPLLREIAALARDLAPVPIPDEKSTPTGEATSPRNETTPLTMEAVG
ncbi:MAG: hypothetical protein R8F63_20180 [Acidimicrobiales bacterium]|nr:hypothetical protein [Acidimicrobiales bacterium]